MQLRPIALAVTLALAAAGKPPCPAASSRSAC
jgi:hypothetical protein